MIIVINKKFMSKLTKVIIPIAGLGTRLLPATKAIPKEMLPIINKPIIQYVVEETVSAGFKEIIFVTHSSKASVENHFDTSFELEATLEKRLKRSLLKEIKSISKLNIIIQSIRQGEAKGLGHAVLCASSLVGNQPFAIVLPDMVFRNSGKNNDLHQMKINFEKNEISSILLNTSKKSDLSNYGVVSFKNKQTSKKEVFIRDLVEKPSPSKAPSTYFASGRYIFTNNFLNHLDELKPDKSGEIQLTSGISDFINNGNNLIGHKSSETVYDCGNKLGYLKAIIDFGIDDKSISKDIKHHLKTII